MTAASTTTLSPAELERARRFKVAYTWSEVMRCDYHAVPLERLTFARWLVRVGRLGETDRD